MDCNIPCEGLIELRAQFNNMKEDLTEIKSDVKEIGKKFNNVILLEERLKEVKKTANGTVADINKQKEKKSDRNWALWLLLIGATVTSIIGLIVNLLKG